MKKIPKKYASIIFALGMSFAMSACMSGALTAYHLGLTTQALIAWPANFALSFSIALPLALFFVPLMRRAVERITA